MKSFRMSLAIVIALGLLVTNGVAGEPTQAVVSSSLASQSVERLDDEGARALAQIYEYEPTMPLEARVVEKAEKDGLEREKIVFRGVQGFLVPAYLQLPREAAGPCGCVLLLHGWSGSKNNWWEDGNYISGGDVRRQLLAAGFAVMALDAQCHGDRIAENDFAPVNHFRDPAGGDNQRKGYFTMADIYIQTTRDYRRAIDYLATRSEIDSKRIGIIGYSMGGTQTYLLTGVEPRIKAAVAVAAPAEKSKWSPIAPQNFAAAIGSRPFLTILGRTDMMCSVEHAQALQALLPRESSDQQFFDAGHKLPRDYVPRAVEWMKKHL
jgi:dienelactone hydrolase